MSDPLRILIFDDSVADRALTRAMLTEGERAVHVREVRGAVAFAELLGHRSWDVAIGERTVDWADGLELLMTLKRRHPRCATVLFTAHAPDELGMLGHRAAVDAYVRKDSAGYLRLPELIADTARRARGGESGEAAADSVKGSIDSLPLGYFWALSDGSVLRANPVASHLLGIDRDPEAPGNSLLHALSDPLERARCAKAMQLGERLAPTPVRVHDLACFLSIWPVPDVGGRACVEGLVWEIEGAPAASYHRIADADALRASSPMAPLNPLVDTAPPQHPPPGPGADPAVPTSVTLLRQPRSSDGLPTRRPGPGQGSESPHRPDVGHAAGSEGETNGASMAAPKTDPRPLAATSSDPRAGIETTARIAAHDLSLSMQATAERLRHSLRARGLRLACGPLPYLRIDPDHAQRLLRETLEFLLELDPGASTRAPDLESADSADTSPLRLEVRADPQANGWLVSARHPLAHLAPAIHRWLTSGDTLGDGSEHPLAIARRIAKRYGGELWLTSSSAHGTTVLLSLALDSEPMARLSIHVDGQAIGEISMPQRASKRGIARAALALPEVRRRMGERRITDVRLGAGGVAHLIAAKARPRT